MRRAKRCLCVFLLLGILTGTACSPKNKGTKEENTFSTSFSSFYRIEKQQIPIQDVLDETITNDGCYFLQLLESDEYIEAEEWLTKELMKANPSSLIPRNQNGEAVFPDYFLSFYDLSGTCIFNLDANKLLGPSLSTRPMCSDREGNLWIANLIVEEKTETLSYICAELDKSGTILKNFELFPEIYISQVYDIFPFNDGRIGMTVDAEDTTVYLEFNLKGTQICSVELEMLAPEIIGMNDKIYIFDIGSETKCEIVENKAENIENLSQGTIDVVGASGKLFCANETGLQEFKNDQSKLLWQDLFMTYAPDEMLINDNGDMRILSFSIVSPTCTLYTINPSETDPYGDITTVTIAGYDIRSDDSLIFAIELLNEGNPSCQYVIRDYSDELGSNKKLLREKMRLEIIEGSAPDIYFDKYMDLDLRDFCKDDYLVDMSEHLALHEREFYYDILKMHQEHAHVICTDFSVTCFSALSSTVDDTEKWDFDSLYAAASSFDDSSMVQGIYTKEELLYKSLSMDIGKYVNFQTGEVDFSKESFVQLLKWVNDVGCQESWTCTGLAELQDRRIMMDFEQFNGINSLLSTKSYNADIKFVGFPNASGKLPYIARNMCAISAKTSHLPEAYAFIDNILSEQCQLYVTDNPVSKSAFQKKMDSEYTLYMKHFDSENESVRFDKQSIMDEYAAIIEKSKVCMNFGSTEIYNIILEEAQPFFYGDRSIEETIPVIQERVKIYVNEVKEK